MESIIVRQATLADLNTLLEFEQGVIKAERPFDVTIKEGYVNYYDLKEMIAVPHIEVAVAELNGNLIASGYARTETSKSFLKFEKHAYLGFMYVVPQHRGKGVINKIIDYLKAWAAAKELTELRLEVYTENRQAISAYEKIGFSKLLIEMRMHVK